MSVAESGTPDKHSNINNDDTIRNPTDSESSARMEKGSGKAVVPEMTTLVTMALSKEGNEEEEQLQQQSQQQDLHQMEDGSKSTAKQINEKSSPAQTSPAPLSETEALSSVSKAQALSLAPAMVPSSKQGTLEIISGTQTTDRLPREEAALPNDNGEVDDDAQEDSNDAGVRQRHHFHQRHSSLPSPPPLLKQQSPQQPQQQSSILRSLSKIKFLRKSISSDSVASARSNSSSSSNSAPPPTTLTRTFHSEKSQLSPPPSPDKSHHQEGGNDTGMIPTSNIQLQHYSASEKNLDESKDEKNYDNLGPGENSDARLPPSPGSKKSLINVMHRVKDTLSKSFSESNFRRQLVAVFSDGEDDEVTGHTSTSTSLFWGSNRESPTRLRTYLNDLNIEDMRKHSAPAELPMRDSNEINTLNSCQDQKLFEPRRLSELEYQNLKSSLKNSKSQNFISEAKDLRQLSPHNFVSESISIPSSPISLSLGSTISESNSVSLMSSPQPVPMRKFVTFDQTVLIGMTHKSSKYDRKWQHPKRSKKEVLEIHGELFLLRQELFPRWNQQRQEQLALFKAAADAVENDTGYSATDTDESGDEDNVLSKSITDSCSINLNTGPIDFDPARTSSKVNSPTEKKIFEF